MLWHEYIQGNSLKVTKSLHFFLTKSVITHSCKEYIAQKKLFYTMLLSDNRFFCSWNIHTSAVDHSLDCFVPRQVLVTLLREEQKIAVGHSEPGSCQTCVNYTSVPAQLPILFVYFTQIYLFMEIRGKGREHRAGPGSAADYSGRGLGMYRLECV